MNLARTTPVPSHSQGRHHWIDLLRGIAILLMIPANLSPYFTEPHPMWYRVFGSFAAPVFISLSAGLVRWRGTHHDEWYYVKRGGAVLLVGMLLDVFLWGIFPWTSFDTLYIIGLAMPLVHATRRLRARWMFVIAGVLFAGSYVLQSMTGYNPEALEIYITHIEWPTLARLFHSWFVDGWFPMLPWLGFAFFGAGVFGATIQKGRDIRTVHTAAVGLLLVVAGILLLTMPIPHLPNFMSGAIITSREGYSEIFYPPTVGYISCATGAFLLMSWLARSFERSPVLSIFPFFGHFSMMVYILHQVIGSKMLSPLLASMGVEAIESGLMFTAANLAVIALIAVICALLRRIPKNRVTDSLFIRVLLGR